MVAARTVPRPRLECAQGLRTDDALRADFCMPHEVVWRTGSFEAEDEDGDRARFRRCVMHARIDAARHAGGDEALFAQFAHFPRFARTPCGGYLSGG